MKTINLTPHIVRLNDGRELPPSGTVRNDGPVDVVSCTGQWIGSDDSGGWFGGD